MCSGEVLAFDCYYINITSWMLFVCSTKILNSLKKQKTLLNGIEALLYQFTVRKTAGKLASDSSTAPLRLIYNKVSSKMRIPKKNSDKNKHCMQHSKLQFSIYFQLPTA